MEDKSYPITRVIVTFLQDYGYTAKIISDTGRLK